MKTENTNDFSKCRVGDKLWCAYFWQHWDFEHNCIVTEVTQNSVKVQHINSAWDIIYRHDQSTVKVPTLFFSRPQFIAPPEPPRLPDYKEGQWIAVFDGHAIPHNIGVFTFHGWHFDAPVIKNGSGGGAVTHSKRAHHCTLEELPEVLAKWGEPK